ncbi:hypothetical protein D1007_59328 [Hordeum vulgare]|nr:hypothetical protein D1007_59328 [Hordeum vulgare]
MMFLRTETTAMIEIALQITEIIMHSNSGRKYDSGAFKRKKKHKLDEDPQSQYGALDKYVVKGPQTNSENQTPNANIDDGQDVNAVDVEVVAAEIQEGDHGYCDNAQEGEVTATEISDDNDVNISDEDHDPNISDDMNNSVQPDIFDPRNWDGLDPRKIDILLQKGPKREDIEYGPYDKFSRRISGCDDSHNDYRENSVEMDSRTSHEKKASDPSSPSSHGLPKAATRQRKKLVSDEEDSDFVPHDT